MVCELIPTDEPKETVCAYASFLSWDGPGRPRPNLVSPRAVFERLFGAGGGAEASARRIRQRRSVLDAVLDDVRRLDARLGVDDAQRVDAYLTALREVERSLDEPPRVSAACRSGRDAYVASLGDAAALDIVTHVRQMQALMVLALQCDHTRVLTYMLGNNSSNRPFPHVAGYASHHVLNHHEDDPAVIEQLLAVERWCVGELAWLVDQLQGVDEGDGSTLLDNTLVLVCTELADGNLHSQIDGSMLLIGDLQGRLRTGRHLRFGGDRPHTDLLRAVLEAYGLPGDDFGERATATMTEVLA